jgi:hypothetical protein
VVNIVAVQQTSLNTFIDGTTERGNTHKRLGYISCKDDLFSIYINPPWLERGWNPIKLLAMVIKANMPLIEMTGYNLFRQKSWIRTICNVQAYPEVKAL